MDEERTAPRLFTEGEVGKILKQASELQRREQRDEPAGLDVAELRQIAAELGIDPKFVSAAIAGMQDNPENSTSAQLLGAPLSLTVERVVSGEIDDEAWEAVAGEIRRVFKRAGTTTKVGRSWEWTYTHGKGQMQVTVTSRKGRTRIRVFSFHPKLAVLSYLLTFYATGALLALLGPFGLASWWAVVVLIPVFVLLARLAFGAAVRQRERKAQHLIGQLEEIITQASASRVTETEAVPTKQRIDASLLEADEIPETQHQGTRARTR